MTQSKHNSGRKRARTVDEESQLFHPASKRRDLNPNRDVLDISALSIHASNGGNNLTNGTSSQVTSLQYPQGSSSNMPTCSRVPHNSSQLPLPSQAMLKPNDSRHQNQGMMGHYDSDSEDESPSLTYYTDINMVLKEAHFELLRRQKITFPE